MSDGEEFSWSTEEVVVEAVEAIAVYKNSKGNIVIRQQRSRTGDEDAFVVVPRDKVSELIAAINKENED
jgi:hypothetical protein